MNEYLIFSYFARGFSKIWAKLYKYNLNKALYLYYFT